jgi:hypothetical protein
MSVIVTDPVRMHVLLLSPDPRASAISIDKSGALLASACLLKSRISRERNIQQSQCAIRMLRGSQGAELTVCVKKRYPRQKKYKLASTSTCSHF